VGWFSRYLEKVPDRCVPMPEHRIMALVLVMDSLRFHRRKWVVNGLRTR
jgi:hypothetical protein